VNGVYIRPIEAFWLEVENTNDWIRPLDGFDQSKVIRDTKVSLKPHNGYWHRGFCLARLF